MKKNDLIGQKFNRLLVVDHIKIKDYWYWICKCECGNETKQQTSALIKGTVKSCGCYNKEFSRDRMLKFDNVLTKEFLTKEYVENKKSLRTIAKEVGCSSTTIKPYLDFHNISREDIEMIGKQFGKLTVMSLVPNGYNKNCKWLCQCECGNQKEFYTKQLTKRKSCGCYKEIPYNFCGYKDLSGVYYSRVKKGAISRNLSFNITIEEIWELFEKQNEKCALSSLPIALNKNKKQTASLDRIDSSKGYEKDNIQWVHKDINRMKNNFPEERLFFICTQILEKNGKI